MLNVLVKGSRMSICTGDMLKYVLLIDGLCVGAAEMLTVFRGFIGNGPGNMFYSSISMACNIS